MSENKHTPAPWRIIEEGLSDRYLIVDAEDGAICTPCWGRKGTLDIGNAQLIVAAPEMFAALERIANLRHLPVGTQQEEMSARLEAASIASAAIAIAKGGAA